MTIMVYVRRETGNVVVGGLNGEGEKIKKSITEGEVFTEILRKLNDRNRLPDEDLRQRVENTVLRALLGGELKIVID